MNYHTVKLYGAITAMVRDSTDRAGRRTRYFALLSWNKGTWTDEQYCDYNHRSLKAAKRYACNLQWKDKKKS